MKLEGVDTVEGATALRNRVLYMKRSDAKIPAGSYFIAELVDCRVIDADDEEQKDAIHGCRVRLSDEVHRFPCFIGRTARCFFSIGGFK